MRSRTCISMTCFSFSKGPVVITVDSSDEETCLETPLLELPQDQLLEPPPVALEGETQEVKLTSINRAGRPCGVPRTISPPPSGRMYVCDDGSSTTGHEASTSSIGSVSR